MNKEDIKKIIEISVNAPSGSNSQPWSFRVKENKIYISAYPEKDHPILNYKNRGTWIAHGALIENIVIASSSFGYNAKVEIFPDENQPNLTAVIELSSGNAKCDPLFSAICLRTTNRKKYQNKLLDEKQKKELFESVSQFKDIELKFIEDRSQLISIGDGLSMNEVVTLEDRKLHKLFFGEIVWSKKEEAEKKSGFYFKTMELGLPQQSVLKFFRSWKVMNFFNRFKFAGMIAKDNAKIYASGAGAGFIIVKGEDKDFITAGRTIERLWLKATQMGLSFHPNVGTIFYRFAMQNNNNGFFSPRHIKIIAEASDNFSKILNLKKGTIAFAFRIGFSKAPSALSTKKSPEIIWQ